MIEEITVENHPSGQGNAYKHIQRMASELSLIEERERRKIVVDIHDRIGHNLAALRMRLTSILQMNLHQSESRRWKESRIS